MIKVKSWVAVAVLTHDGSLIGSTRWRDDGSGASQVNRREQKCPRRPQNLRV